MNWKAWAQLIRIPNTLTSCADVLAGMCLMGGIVDSFVVHPIAGLIGSLASILFYWSGMILNDVFDLEIDRVNRRPGPLVTGAIDVGTARRVGYGMMVMGIALAFLAPWTLVPSGRVGVLPMWVPGATGVLLALAILGYDGPMKKSPSAPFLMGICRSLNMALGVTIAGTVSESRLGLAAVGILIGHGVYVTGITLAARRESDMQQARGRLLLGWGVCGLGAAIIALSPWFEPERSYRLGASWIFGALIMVLMMPLARRVMFALTSLSPSKLGMAIRQAILSILFLDAAIALQFAGDLPGIGICLMVIPTLILGNRFRST